MAITRTQIAKQLLEQGGRVGLQGGGADMGTVSTPGRAARDNREIGARMSRTASIGQGDAIRRNQEAFNTGVGISNLERLQKEGVPDVNLGLSSILLNSSPVKKFRNFALNKNIERYKNVTQGPYTLEGYKDYMKSMRDRFTPDDDNDNNNIFLPVDTTFAEAPSNMDQEPEVEEPFEISRRFRAEGGIMNNNVVGGEMDFESARQMYGLGKLVKKVTRSVKKIVKSPIGKAALLYTGLGGLGSIAGGGTFFGNFMSPMSQLRGVGSIFSKGGLENIMSKAKLGKFVADGADGFSFQKNFLGKALTSPSGLIAGTSLIAGALTAEQEEEAQQISDETGINIDEIRANPNKYLARRFRAEGGIMRTNYAEGSEDTENLSNDPNYKGWVKVYEASPEAAEMNKNHSKYLQFYNRKAEGGSMKEPVAKKVMPLLDMDGQEMDLRAEGGFVPIGRMEKADDVPARLSKNEFVFTAEAVRNAGEGDVDKGAEVMYNMMKNLEAGGDVSEESQGLEGAKQMFQTSQRLEEVL